jgi:Ca-activated chloride channel homolog
MEWQHPGWLYLILPLAIGWLLLSLYSQRRRRRAALSFVSQAMQSRILPVDSRARFWLKLLLREAAIVFGLVVLAGPRFGTQYEQVIPRGSDLYVLIDVSRSMLAQDVPPSRLGRAKADVAALVNRLEGERVGLIAFAGAAVVKCPLTVDYDAFRRSLEELDPGSAPRGGTAIGDAIRKALEVFHSRGERDQAILLITDGDDQQSYPLEAAAVAAERHVTIFSVGLGDADQGARIPQSAQSQTYLEYQGQQVWSKLDGKLLKEIALKTSGVYVPVGTRAYDLGELYKDYLQGRRGSAALSHRRIRRAEQFQIFLALALAALLADLFTRPYAAAVKSPQMETEPRAPRRASAIARQPALPVALAIAACLPWGATARADNPDASLSEGLRLYRADQFDMAREKFAAAREEFAKKDAGKSAIAAFDEACAFHRKGDTAHARESYLKAGLAHDKALAAAAHFNLGTLASEEARGLAGENPETVAPEKRQEILDHLKGAVASFRHSLELQPENLRARRDIELVRLWIKYYTDKWQEHDREKRRREMNLLAFLEFLIETQRALRESVKALPARTPADAFAELKRLQNELQGEIAPLKEKIRADLAPAPQPGAGSAPPASSQELEQGITLLQGWADAAGEKMSSAARQLESRQAATAAADQQAAVDELEKIWDAVIPFHPLLARDLADQTMTAGALKPAAEGSSQKKESERDQKESERDQSAAPPGTLSAAAGESSLVSGDEDLARLLEVQERTLRRTRLLKPKAEAQLARVKQAPPPPAAEEQKKGAASRKDDARPGPGAEPKPVDPKAMQAGYEKAIELSPQAVAQMERAVKALEKKDRAAAYPPAEAARKVLEEIQKAQPKQDDSKQKDQEQDKKKEEQQKDQEKQEQKKDEQKPEQQKDEREKNEQQKKEEQKQQQDQNKGADKKEKDNRPQPQISRDQLEEALRKVRERQQEKRERDRRMRARVSGSVPVEKDW